MYINKTPDQKIAELRQRLQRLINLSGHPLFIPQEDLPAWKEAVAEARETLAEPD